MIDNFDNWVAESDSSKAEVAMEFLKELENLNLNHDLLSNDRQLKNGNIFFEFKGRKIQKLVGMALAEYNLDKSFIVPNIAGKEFMDNVHTGTKYYFSGNGFVKHNTGPRKVMFGTDHNSIKKALEWIIDNAKTYIIQLAMNQGYTTYLNKSSAVYKEVDPSLFENFCSEEVMDAVRQMKKFRPTFYPALASEFLVHICMLQIDGFPQQLDELAINSYGGGNNFGANAKYDPWKEATMNIYSNTLFQMEYNATVSKSNNTVSAKLVFNYAVRNPEMKNTVHAKIMSEPTSIKELLHKFRGKIAGNNFGL